jgi:hypothetical protein
MDNIVEQILIQILTSDPELIIQFNGSYYSDDAPSLCFFVVTNNYPSLSHTRRSVAIRGLINVDDAVDIIAYTPDELRESLRKPDSFTSQILRDGSILYEK